MKSLGKGGGSQKFAKGDFERQDEALKFLQEQSGDT